MGLYRLALVFLIVASPLCANDSTRSQILFLAQQGDIKRALDDYQEKIVKQNGHDFRLLRQLGVVILRLGVHAKSQEGQLMTLLGTGVAQDESLFPIVKAALFSGHPQVQLIAVDMLANYHDDEADACLLAAMGSPFVTTRLEAALRLIEIGHPEAVGQLQALQTKVVPELYPIFPQLYALAGNAAGDATLRRILAEGQAAEKRAAAHFLSQYGRDDFLPEIRKQLGQLDPMLQEVSAAAIGKLRDTSSLSHVQRLARSKDSKVACAALIALYQLGHDEAVRSLEARGMQKDPFAIYALGAMDGSEDTLGKLAGHKDLQVRANAAVALLMQRDRRSLPGIKELLIKDNRDLAVIPHQSVAGGLQAVRVIPNEMAQAKKNEVLPAVSLAMREQILAEAIELEEGDFIWLANQIFSAKQNDLIPLLTKLLENHPSEQAIKLLKREQMRAGAPLIRGYCNLALFRLGEEGSYATDLREWLARQPKRKLIEIRPYLPWHKRVKENDDYALTADETSRLLLQSYETLAQKHDIEAVETLLSAIANGHPDNRYALAGLLLRITE